MIGIALFMIGLMNFVKKLIVFLFLVEVSGNLE